MTPSRLGEGIVMPVRASVGSGPGDCLTIVPAVVPVVEEATDYDWYLAGIERERERGH